MGSIFPSLQSDVRPVNSVGDIRVPIEEQPQQCATCSVTKQTLWSENGHVVTMFFINAILARSIFNNVQLNSGKQPVTDRIKPLTLPAYQRILFKGHFFL